MMNRRDFLRASGGAAALLAIGSRSAYAFSQSPALGFFQTTLRGLGLDANRGSFTTAASYAAGTIPVASPDGTWDAGGGHTGHHYTIVAGEYRDWLHPSLPSTGTKLWGYANYKTQPQLKDVVFRHLGGLIATNRGDPVQMTVVNRLPGTHILPVDTTQLSAGESAHNRIAVHLHGGWIPWISDGGPFDWYTPTGTHGSSFINNNVTYPFAQPVITGGGEYFYPNDQSNRLMWYHDHAHGITRLNAYAGIATGYVVREPNGLEGHLIADVTNHGFPAYAEAGGPEIPLVIQDKIFKNGNPQAVRSFPQYELPIGDLWYPYVYDRSRWAQGSYTSPPRVPSCIPESFGDTMLVNGTVFPTATIPPGVYRLRVLNACNARFVNLQWYVHDGTTDGITLSNTVQVPGKAPGTYYPQGAPTNAKGPDMWQVGNECGFLPNPVHLQNTPFYLDPVALSTGNPDFRTMQSNCLLAPAERADLLVDFRTDPSGAAYPDGTKFILYSDTPAPFPGGDPLNDYKPHGNGKGPCTRILMQIQIGGTATTQHPIADMIADDLSSGVGMDPPSRLPSYGIYGPAIQDIDFPVGHPPIRDLILNELYDNNGRLMQLMGTPGPAATAGLAYQDPASEIINHGAVEIWRIANMTGDTHPIHFHLVNWEFIGRQAFDPASYNVGTLALLNGTSPREPDPNEKGWKETVRINPGEIVTLLTKFDLSVTPFTVPGSPRTGMGGGNEYVYHCHILEHEEHDMMRPLVVL